jgi:RNA polymerase sigma-70 factor (ECF subfamily)
MSAGPELSGALERLVSTYAQMVRQVARQRGLDPAEVEDVLQDVRIRLWKAVPGESMERINTSYVYRTAMAAVCDHVRRRRGSRLDSLDDAMTANSERLGATDRPDDALERAELGRRIEAAVAELTDSRRPVVRMYLAGYAQAEIQELFGWTEAKTRNLLYRGLSELRLTLSRMGVGPEAAT